MAERRNYNTRQQEQLIEFFRKNKQQCFTSKQIIDEPSIGISEATTYRILNRLSDSGVIKKFISDENSGSMYQYSGCNESCNHLHLKCTSCGKLIHLDCHEIRNVEQHVEQNHGFTIDDTKTILYGICKECRQF